MSVHCKDNFPFGFKVQRQLLRLDIRQPPLLLAFGIAKLILFKRGIAQTEHGSIRVRFRLAKGYNMSMHSAIDLATKPQ